MENEEQNEGAAGRSGLGPGAWGLMALVALITVIAVWLVPVDDKNTTPSLPDLPNSPGTVEQPLALPGQDTAGTQPSDPGENMAETPSSASGADESADKVATRSLDLPLPPGGVATVTNGGEGARAYLYKLRAEGGQPDPEVVFAEAERRQGAGELEDAYLLYRYAARHGQVQAAMKLGTAADPAYHSALNSYLPEPAPGQARKWYSLAAAAGESEAGQRLEDLRVRLERDASSGDEQAERLLLQWR